MKSAQLTIGDAAVSVRDAGSGPDAMVLLHGGTPGLSPYLPSSLLWEPLVQELAPQLPRVVAIDLPGTGSTAVVDHQALKLSAISELIRGALPELGIERAIVVGHGQASLVALSLAREPGETELAGVGLIAASGAAPTSDGVTNVTLSYPPIPPWSAESQRWALTRLSFTTEHITPALVAALVAEAGGEGPLRAAELLSDRDFGNEIRADRLGAKLEHFAFARDHGYGIPITIVWGANDPLLSLAHGDGTFEVLSTTTAHLDFAVIPRAGHLPHRDQPAEVAHQLRRLWELVLPRPEQTRAIYQGAA